MGVLVKISSESGIEEVPDIPSEPHGTLRIMAERSLENNQEVQITYALWTTRRRLIEVIGRG